MGKKNKGGRPTKLTPECVKKLEEAFSIDATVEEACFYAGISTRTFYTWKDENEQLFHTIEALRQKPVLKARQTVVTSLSDPNHAFRYLERKRPEEFQPKAKVEHSGKVETHDVTATEAVKKVTEEYEGKLREAIAKGA